MSANPLEELPRALDALVAKARRDERADVLAFLRKRAAAAETVARNYPEDAERAARIVQQIGIEIEMIEQGLHVGDAELMAALSEVVETNTFNQDVAA